MDLSSTQYEIEKLILTGLFGFALGVAGNIITFYLLNRDRYIRSLERESKRLAYWKAMRELKADNSVETGLSQPKCQQLMSDSSKTFRGPST